MRSSMPGCLTFTAHPAHAELERRDGHFADVVRRAHWHRLWLMALGTTCSAVAWTEAY
jgi:hypothetical protein